MKKIYILIIILCTLALKSLACECDYKGMKIDYENAEFVIIGNVQNILDLTFSNIQETLPYKLNPNYTLKGGYLVEIKVLNEFKGSVPSVITITPDWSNCDFLFNKNEEYVIFGYIDENNKFKTNICTSNFLRKNSKKEKELIKLSSN